MGKCTSDAQPNWILLIDVLNDSQLHLECWEIPKTLLLYMFWTLHNGKVARPNFLAFQQLFYYLENHKNAYISAKSQWI